MILSCDDLGVVAHAVLLFVFFPFLDVTGSGLEVIVVGDVVFNERFGHNGAVFYFGSGVVEIDCEVIIVFIILHLLLIKYKYFSKPSQIIIFILISTFGLLNRQGDLLLGIVSFAFTRHHPLLNLTVTFHLHLLFPLVVNIQQVQCIRYQILFNVLVKRSIGRETGSVVDLEQIGIQFMINHNVEA